MKQHKTPIKPATESPRGRQCTKPTIRRGAPFAFGKDLVEISGNPPLFQLKPNRQTTARQTLYTDGGCSNNHQRDATKRRMVFAVLNETGIVLVDKYEFGGSNNIAELLAVREALVWAKANEISRLKVITDSKNNIAWANGRFSFTINDYDRVAAIYNDVVALREYVELTLVWVPREENAAGIYLESKKQEALLGIPLVHEAAQSMVRIAGKGIVHACVNQTRAVA